MIQLRRQRATIPPPPAVGVPSLKIYCSLGTCFSCVAQNNRDETDFLYSCACQFHAYLRHWRARVQSPRGVSL
jgi:hypothetical protein